MNDELKSDYNLDEIKAQLMSLKHEVADTASPKVSRAMWSSLRKAVYDWKREDTPDSDLERASSTDEDKPYLLQTGFNTTTKKSKHWNWWTFSWRENQSAIC